MLLPLFVLLLASPGDRADSLIQAIAKSDRVMTVGAARDKLADPTREIAPGPPPLLAFRYYEGAERHRFGKLDVMLDDAGH